MFSLPLLYVYPLVDIYSNFHQQQVIYLLFNFLAKSGQVLLRGMLPMAWSLMSTLMSVVSLGEGDSIHGPLLTQRGTASRWVDGFLLLDWL
jgi:hypothetical protein